MNTASWIVYHELLSRCPAEKKAALMSFLSTEEKRKLNELHSLTHDPFTKIRSIDEHLAGVHYSWMIPFLEPFSDHDKRAILSSLNSLQADKLKNHFKISGNLFSLTGHATKFLQKSLYDWLISDQKDFIPLDFLPPHPLNALLELSKGALQHLVDFLGIHDLALEMKKIVQSSQIKKIQNALQKPERDYLKTLLRQKEPLSFARLNLDAWDGNEDKLKNILHHRGFNRLAKALFGCHPSLIWHISHRFDTGRTKILRKFFSDINNEKAQEALIHQILELIPVIRKHYE